MWSKSFEQAYGNREFVYRGRKIPVKDLGLGSDCLGYFCRHIFGNRNGCIDNITYNKIHSIRAIGDKKARAIAEALVKQGVEINDIPEDKGPTRLINVDNRWPTCTNCDSVFYSNTDAYDQLFNYCPMCGKKFKW